MPRPPLIRALLLLFTLSAHAQVLTPRSPADRIIPLDIITPTAIAPTSLTVRDNNMPIPPAQLQASTTPATPEVLILLDAVNASFDDLARAQHALETVLRKSPAHLPHPTGLLFLTPSSGAPNSPRSRSLPGRQLTLRRTVPTTDPQNLLHELAAFKPPLPSDTLSPADRVPRSLDALAFLATAEAQDPAPKLLLCLSPGWPFLAPPEAAASPQLFDSVVAFSQLLRSARLILTVVDPRGLISHDTSASTEAFFLGSRPGSSRTPMRPPANITETYFQQFLAPVRTAADANPNDLSLQVLAIHSGGLVLEGNNDFAVLLRQALSDADHLTTLLYLPSPAAHPGLAWHTVEVTAPGNSHPLRTRSGFYTR